MSVQLRDFGVLTNENIHPAVVMFLRAAGFDALTAAEAGLLGSEDVAVLRRAAAENRFALTHDADFGRLASAAGEPFVGIVYLRPGHIQPEFSIGALEGLLARNVAVSAPFIVVVRRARDRLSIRVRSAP